MTISEVVRQLPEATRVFENFSIDYCCGGNQLLGDACKAAGLQVKEVISLLDGLSQANDTNSRQLDFQKLSLTELITHILETHHVFTKSEMLRLARLVDKVTDAHSSNHPELFKVGELFQRLCADLKPHMFKEEEILFPYLMLLDAANKQEQAKPFAPFGTVNNPIGVMMAEHEAAGMILKELRNVTADYRVPSDGCASYETLYRSLAAFEADLHQHIHLENNILFPQAITLEAR